MEPRSFLKSKWLKNIAGTICFAEAFLFMYTGCSKLLDHHNFARQLSAVFRWPPLYLLISYAVPLAELSVAIGLVFLYTRQAAMRCFTWMMLLFTLYVAVLLITFTNLPCSCGGIISSLTWTEHLVINCLLLAMGITGVRLQKNIQQLKIKI